MTKWYDEQERKFWDKWREDQAADQPDYRIDITPPVPRPFEKRKSAEQKEIERLTDLGDKNWSRDKDVLGFEVDKATKESIKPKSFETSAEKESRQIRIEQIRNEKIQELKDEERWNKLRASGTANISISSSKDAERQALATALALEKDYRATLKESLIIGKTVSQEERNNLEELRKKAEAHKEAFLRDRFDYQYPGSVVGRVYYGDPVYGAKFIGEGDVLLYHVKNMMKTYSLKQNRGVRVYSDGTVITAKSAFGVDSIEIDTRTVTPTEGANRCTIELLNVPEIVQPMRFPGYIGRGQTVLNVSGHQFTLPNEVEGVDYIKTYYRFETNCNSCAELDFTVCDTADLAADSPILDLFDTGEFYTSTVNCGPFFFLDSTVPHYTRQASAVSEFYENILNHCIYSFWGCQAEIIEFGRDGNGTFFLWKAYTEYSRFFPLDSSEISRTGLGYLKLRGFQKLKSSDTEDLCTSESFLVKVDCCVKPLADRHIHLWWERAVDCPFMFYGSMKVCEIPARTLGYYELIHYAESYGGGIWTFPDVHGTCIPFEWEQTGPGHLHLAEPFAHWGSYDPDPLRYTEPKCDPVEITITDRCGSSRTIRADCCETQELGKLAISYTTLIMTINQEQTILVGGGCPPYTVTFSGVGTWEDLTTVATTPQFLYTAPAALANCSENALISVTDCCGDTDSITILVREYFAGVTAYWITVQANCGCVDAPAVGKCADWWPGETNCYIPMSCAYAYDCADQLIYSSKYFYGGALDNNWHFVEAPPNDLFTDCPCTATSSYIGEGHAGPHALSWGACHVGVDCDILCVQLTFCGGQDLACNQTYDVRTALMISRGCCPAGLS